MQRLSGVLMVLAGTALGGYTVMTAPHDGADRLAEITRIAAAPDRGAAAGAQSNIATIETGAVTSANAQTTGPAAASAANPPAASENPGGTRVFSPNAPLAAPAATSTWTAVVTSEAASNGKMSSPRPGDAGTRAALASDLQRELKRVGCYGGEITGTWTPSTKKAMSAFMERVNATLPVEEPDYILLTLVQGHAAAACGAECPTGQVQSGDGRCVPHAVVAQALRNQASRKTQRDDERRASEERKAQQQERLALEQRAVDAMRVADASKAAAAAGAETARKDGQRLADDQKAAEAQRVAVAAVAPPAPKPAVRPAAANPHVEKPVQKPTQQIAAVEPERLPWLADTTTASAAPSAAPSSRPAPLPGMMSIGGPQASALEKPASLSAGAPAAVAPAAIAPAAVVPDRAPRPAVVIEDRLDTPAAPSAASSNGQARVTGTAPQPSPVVRQAALLGMPGSKSGVAAQHSVVREAAIAGLPGSKSGIASQSVVRNPPPVVSKYRSAKIVRRPPPFIVYSPKPKSYSYASSSGGKSRRGQPRPGSMQYNVMHSLGGIY